MKIKDKEQLTRKSSDISKWYLEIIKLAKLIDYGPSKGTIIFRPNGYAIWENMQQVLDGQFKRNGIKNAYFPIFIPYSLLKKEQKHVEGFSPELALVTVGGGEKLDKPLVIRPTSEAIIYERFAKWISSYKDLPIKINQWCNVVRWEKRTYPFLRTTEFLWQEGHTVHSHEAEAREMTMQALDWYKKFYEKVLGVSVYVGKKSESEKFAGAEDTFSIEIVIPDGKALQASTSHFLGQNFAKAFGITYLDEHNETVYPHQTSWGLSTRAIGGMILVHGDDNGLVTPPYIAPYQVVIIQIESKNKETKKKIGLYIKSIQDLLDKNNIRYIIDNNFDKSLGYRISEAEIRGYPIRLEIGPTEYERKTILVSRRDTMGKEYIKLKGLGGTINALMDDIQGSLLIKSEKMKKDFTKDVNTYAEFKKIMKTERKFIRAYWCENGDCEKAIKDETKATTRVVELKHLNDKDNMKCIKCQKKADRKWLFAQAY